MCVRISIDFQILIDNKNVKKQGRVYCDILIVRLSIYLISQNIFNFC